MKIILNFTLLFFCLTASSQNFQPGYFITNEGEKIEALIDNTDGFRNPENFQYKLFPEDQIKKKTLNEVKIFEILDTPYKFERAIVNLDLSSDNFKTLSANREPVFRQDTVFLRVSIDGPANLYVYKSANLPIRFFYSLDKTKIEPLIFKKYLVDGTKINTNNRYKQQLINELKCLSLEPGKLSGLGYSEKSLNDIFLKYNICEEGDYVNYLGKRRKGEFNLALKAGISYSALNFIQKNPFPNEQKMEPYVSPRIGIELEYVFPFLHNKFAVISYPSYQYSTTSHETLIYRSGEVPSNPGAWVGERENLLLDFSRIMLPIGLRAYYYQRNNIDLYLQGAIVYNVLTNPSDAYNFENFQTTFRSQNTTIDPNFDISTGLKFGKLNLEVIYSLATYVRGSGFDTKIENPITLNLGYKIF